jgi:hypothetical protein
LVISIFANCFKRFMAKIKSTHIPRRYVVNL